MAGTIDLLKQGLEFLKPTLEKISLAFFLLFIVFLGLLIDIPEWIYIPLMTILAWPLVGLAQLCGQSDLECQNAASFIGLILSLIYWYLAACFLSWALENPEEKEEE
ncbi:MAG: hypothetical protein V1835_05560 [Candidatus Micrarchaeota archaeon]